MTLRLTSFLMLFVCSVVFSQSIEGIVRDKATQLPLEAATVYFDGTTLVGLTDADGHFKIGSTTNAGKLLVASYVGYESVKIPNPDGSKMLAIELEKDVVGLQEVVLHKSSFSQKEMMGVFKKYFIGTSKAAKSCKIENEQDVVLFFDPEEKVLTATAKNPLRVTNHYLGYDVSVEVKEFQLFYKGITLDDAALLKSVFSVSSFYKDKDASQKNSTRRREAYLGSASHFMNTLAHGQLDQEKFELYLGQTKIYPVAYFQVKDTLGIKKVTLVKEPQMAVKERIDLNKPPTPDNMSATTVLKKAAMQVVYDKKNRSWLSFRVSDFLVDDNGNYLPNYGLMLFGYMASLKVGDLLPTDYYQTLKAQRPD